MQPGRAIGFWLVVILLLFFGIQLLILDRPTEYSISYTTFIKQVENGNVAEIVQNQRMITGKLAAKEMLPVDDGSHQDVLSFKTVLPTEQALDIAMLMEKNPDIEIKGEVRGVNWWSALLSYLPFIILLGVWLFFLRQMQAGGNRAFSFGKSKARLINADRPQVTFADVAGCDEAKVELEEIIEFLKSPRKFHRLGGRIPKGALLVGQPGTGKTLLAKAVAGEAGVPFFTMSGSDFVEMFVGVGASRVRDLFEQGKKHAPCIIFIDEIDAVGRHRGAGLGGGHDEREQTLNQLLVEMDGFETNEGVILVAATNRPDVLDPALLRPGRFDRQITIDMPDLVGREGILKVHMRKVQAGPDVDVKKIARGTPGLSGADLANLVNEGALLAARRNHEHVTMDDLEDAKERVMLGPERKARVMAEEERRRTAFHESGHAIVAASLENYDPVHKVSIIPRGMALGVTFVLPEEDRYDVTRDKVEATIAFAMGGRAAESLVFPQVGAGAADDIKKATSFARRMVTTWGMSDRLGPVAFGDNNEQVFLGRDLAHRRDYSEQTAIAIDEEVHRIVTTGFERAKKILSDRKVQLNIMAEALLERETLEGEDVKMILAGQELPPMKAAEDPEPAESPADEDEKKTSENEGGLSGGRILGGEVPPPTAS
jgi:cell division protease FtsH